MRNLYRLVYTSFRKPNCTEQEINKILASCKKNNPDRDITGVLVHSDKRFIQYIEGSKEEVESLYQLIEKDERHTAVNKRSFEPIDKRLFPSWEMGYKDLGSSKLVLQTDFEEADRRKFEGIINSELDFDNDGLRLLQLFFRS